MTHPEIGPISEGTTRTADLLTTFANYLEAHIPAHTLEQNKSHNVISITSQTAQLINDARNIDPESRPEAADDIVIELICTLDSLAAPYTFFGAHSGDGACFGFWPNLFEVNAQIHDGEMLKVNDLADVPNDWCGPVLVVNDHGNQTLYGVKKRLVEIWRTI